MAVSATGDLLDWAHAAVVPAGLQDDIVRLVRDTLCVGEAGAAAPGGDAVLAAARGWGAGADARLLGRKTRDGTHLRLPPTSAAFCNAFQIHALEWDAVHEPAVVHAMSVVTAVVMALADRAGGAARQDIAAAIAVGVDVAAGLGLAATGPLRFFRPATAGIIGATIAAARIEGLSRVALGHAVGLAHAQTAGTMQAHVEGSIALPLQIAHAARAAITAVDLARQGLTGPLDPLEGPFGHFALIEEGQLSRYTASLSVEWQITKVSVKPFPSGRASHATLSVLQAIMAEGSLHDADIVRIDAFVPPLVARLIGRAHSADMTPAWARLCLPFLAALMARDGTIDPRHFNPGTFLDDGLAALAARVSVVVDDNPDPNALSPQTLRITTASGAVLERAVPHTLGSPAAPLSPEQTKAKLDLAAAVAPCPSPSLRADPLGWLCDPESP
jgi:2-methylcitrate dehydratase PrpD